MLQRRDGTADDRCIQPEVLGSLGKAAPFDDAQENPPVPQIFSHAIISINSWKNST